MSATVDDLQIKLIAEAKKAETEIDKLIVKFDALEKKVSSFGSNSKSFNMDKSVSNMATNVKKSVSDINSYVDKTAKTIEKKLTDAFNINFKNDTMKKAFSNSVRSLVEKSVGYGKSKGSGDRQVSNKAFNELLASKNSIAKLISSTSGNKDMGNRAGDAIQKEIDNIVRSMRKTYQTAETRMSELRGEFGNLGKDFDKKGGFANLKTPQSVQRAIENTQVKIAKAYESADKSGVGTKGFDSAIKSVITYENHIKQLEERLQELGGIEDRDSVPKTWEERKAAIEAIRQSVKALSEEELAEQTSFEKVRIRGVNDKELAEVESRIQQIREAVEMGVDKGRYADYDKMLEYLHEEHEWLQTNHEYIAKNIPSEEGLVNTVANAIERVNTEIEGVDKSVAKVSTDTKEAVQNVNQTIDSASKKAGFFSESIRNIGTSIKRQFDGGVFKGINVYVPTEQFTKLQAETDKTHEKLLKLKDQLQKGLRSNDKFESTQGYKTLQDDIETTTESLRLLENEMKGMSKFAYTVNWDMVGNGIKKSFSESIAIIRKATSAVGEFVGRLGAPISNALKNMTKNISKFKTANIGLIKSLGKTVRMLRLMVLRMALRGVINQAKESFKELIAFSDKTADSFNKIMNAIHYLGDTLAALVAPVFNASGTFAGMGNIIDALTDKIVDLINKVNQLTSALLGHGTWIKAIKQSKDYASELDKAGKKAKKSLQSFDELNNLMSNDNGNGSGNDGVAGNHFEELPIDPKWKNFADWLADMWDKADFTKLGALLGNKLKDALQKIPWDKIKATARKAGKSLATLLNGFFAVPDLANTIGKTIAEAINTGLEFALSFVQHFDFKQFGKFIGEFISSSLKNIDWSKLKEFAKRLGTGIANAINGLLSTDAIPQIGNAIGAVLRAAVDFAYNLITTIDWKELGVRIREGINAILDQMGEIDATGKSGWEKLGVAISDGLKGVFTALNEVFGDEETRSRVGQAITDFFNGLDIVGIITGARVFIGNLAKGLATVIVSAFKSENFREGLGEIGDLLVGFLALKLSFDGLTKLGKLIGERIGKSLLAELSIVISTDVTAMGALGIFGTTLVTFFAGLNIGNKIGKLIFPEDREMYEEYSGLKGMLTLIKDTYVAIFDDITMRFEKWWNYQKETLGKIKDFFVTTMTDMVNAVRNSDLYQAFVDVFNKIKDFVTGIINTAKNWGHDIVENIKEGIKESKIGQAVDGAIQKIRGNSGGGVYANGKWQHIQGFASGGTPINGEMFLARENGMPELVGRMGSHTAVANNDQIVASVSDGVYRAVVAAMSATQSNTNVNVEIEGDMGKLFRAIRKEGNNYQRRTGNPVFA